MNGLRNHTTLNAQALAILGAILRAAHENRTPPTYRELGRVSGIASMNGVMWHVRRLEKLGLIAIGPRYANRALVPTCRVLIPGDAP